MYMYHKSETYLVNGLSEGVHSLKFTHDIGIILGYNGAIAEREQRLSGE